MSAVNQESLGELFKKLAEHMKQNKNVQVDDEIKYPITVSKFKAYQMNTRINKDVGSFVAVRPVSTDKTHLGIYLGDLPTSHMTTFNPDTGEMSIVMKKNPAMYVPDLKQVVWGMQSWWSFIESEDDLKEITDQDIENVWYVKALNQLAESRSEGESN